VGAKLLGCNCSEVRFAVLGVVILLFRARKRVVGTTLGAGRSGPFAACHHVAPLVGIVTVLIVTVLIVTVALVALVNIALGQLLGGVTLQGLFALLFRPVMWLIGVPWADSAQAAALMGTKTVLNEFVAYVDFAKLPDGTPGPQSRLIMTYALCGFANFDRWAFWSAVSAQWSPTGAVKITALGLRSILSGTIATCMSGAIAGLFA
jgi:concentrative nucleoside transporter, CNT family